MWWRSESLTDEAPTTWFEIYVAKLRDRLRAIWEAQNKHGKRQAKYLIFRAICEQQENRKSLQEVNQVQPEGDDWCARTIDALEWLTKSCGKMMICSNTNCQATKYFIKRYPNNKYCCEKCVATGLKASRARTVKLEKKN
jgi:hypothetical protein